MILSAFAQETAVGHVTSSSDLRPVGGSLDLMALFLSADIVVKSVMILLILTSIVCWAIIFHKWLLVRNLRRDAAQFHARWAEMDNWRALYERINTLKDPLCVVFKALAEEFMQRQKSSFASTNGDIEHAENVARALQHNAEVIIRRNADDLEQWLGFLATTASAAPFVGLFGTVWGIMNSFFSIAASNQTSLAVVAPGIAEALMATALGLVAAIPATIAYNKFSGDIARYIADVENFAYDFTMVLKHQLKSPPPTATQHDYLQTPLPHHDR